MSCFETAQAVESWLFSTGVTLQGRGIPQPTGHCSGLLPKPGTLDVQGSGLGSHWARPVADG